MSITQWNDDPDTTLDEVVAVFKRAEELAV